MILLDTHVVLWMAFEPEKISREAQRRISEARAKNEGLAVSDITLLEIATAANKSRFRVAMTLEEFLKDIETRFAVFPITGRACAQTLQFPPEYPRDPADRIIGATAVVEGMTLITADRNILASKAVQTVW